MSSGAVPIDLLFSANLKILCVAVIGYLSVRFGRLNEQSLKAISGFVVIAALPCLVLDTFIDVLSLEALKSSVWHIAAAVGLNAAGILIALAVKPFFLKKGDARSGIFITLAAMQNSGYLPLPLVQAILPPEQRASGFLFIFMYIFVMGLIFWSVGIRLISKKAGDSISETLRRALNPPIIAMLLGLLFLIPPIKNAIICAPPLRSALKLIGDTTIPLVIFVLGGSFASHAGSKKNPLVLAPSMAIKLVALPFLALLLTRALHVGTLFSVVLVLQAAMPAAMNHIVVSQEYGGDVPLISRALLIQYLASLATVPFFLSLISN